MAHPIIEPSASEASKPGGEGGTPGFAAEPEELELEEGGENKPGSEGGTQG